MHVLLPFSFNVPLRSPLNGMLKFKHEFTIHEIIDVGR